MILHPVYKYLKPRGCGALFLYSFRRGSERYILFGCRAVQDILRYLPRAMTFQSRGVLQRSMRGQICACALFWHRRGAGLSGVRPFLPQPARSSLARRSPYRTPRWGIVPVPLPGLCVLRHAGLCRPAPSGQATTPAAALPVSLPPDVPRTDWRRRTGAYITPCRLRYRRSPARRTGTYITPCRLRYRRSPARRNGASDAFRHPPRGGPRTRA